MASASDALYCAIMGPCELLDCALRSILSLRYFFGSSKLSWTKTGHSGMTAIHFRIKIAFVGLYEWPAYILRRMNLIADMRACSLLASHP